MSKISVTLRRRRNKFDELRALPIHVNVEPPCQPQNANYSSEWAEGDVATMRSKPEPAEDGKKRVHAADFRKIGEDPSLTIASIMDRSLCSILTKP